MNRRKFLGTLAVAATARPAMTSGGFRVQGGAPVLYAHGKERILTAAQVRALMRDLESAYSPHAQWVRAVDKNGNP